MRLEHAAAVDHVERREEVDAVGHRPVPLDDLLVDQRREQRLRVHVPVAAADGRDA